MCMFTATCEKWKKTSERARQSKPCRRVVVAVISAITPRRHIDINGTAFCHMQIVIGMWIEMRPTTALGVKADTAVFFEATELCRRIAANLTWAFTRARKCTHFFFSSSSLSVSFLRTHTRRAEEPFLGSSLYHRHTVFAGKHSILFAGNLDDAFCLPFFFFFFVILRQFLPFSISFCFDKGFRSA